MLNKVITKTVEVTPYGIWTNKEPYLSQMKIWGYPAYKKRTLIDKVEAKSDMCLFIGYPKETIRYQFCNTLEQNLFVAKYIVFLEKELLLIEDNGSKGELGEVRSAQTDTDQLT